MYLIFFVQIQSAPMIRAGMIALIWTITAITAQAQESRSIIFSKSIERATEDALLVHNTPLLSDLIAETLKNNPEIRAAAQEHQAAQQRVAPAGALDDPQVEIGVLYMPIAASPFRTEDMTMKMIGLAQTLPFPGKRDLREAVASKDAEAIEYGYQETINRIVHDLKTAYFDLGLTLELIKLVEKNKQTLEHFLRIAEERYQVGQGSQADVLKAQTQVSRMMDRLIGLAREQPMFEANLLRALGRGMGSKAPTPLSVQLYHEPALKLEALYEAALIQRPRLLALKSLIARSDKVLDLAQKDYYPDFTPRLMYGQRESRLDGTGRADEVSFTVTMNLPVWRKSKLEPRVSEALALRDQAMSLHQAQINEIAATSRQQLAIAEQSYKSAQLYQSTILPQARLTVESSLSAYKVNRVDFLTVLDNQMTVFDYETSLVTAIASYHKALAEIELLVGKRHDEHR
ncbi:TolC family protein [Nitrosomonas sp.]|uniref:TolC family protein n=1 Tax=Nitrosomonas sp. TaxID=42353 RepID=UPI0025EDAAEF|nr:TolC family protein [Nitrosomonas sp.]